MTRIKRIRRKENLLFNLSPIRVIRVIRGLENCMVQKGSVWNRGSRSRHRENALSNRSPVREDSRDVSLAPARARLPDLGSVADGDAAVAHANGGEAGQKHARDGLG